MTFIARAGYMSFPITHELKPSVIMEDEPTHTEQNGYECNDPDCICHWEQSSQYGLYDYDELEQSGTHAPDCRCSWCEPE